MGGRSWALRQAQGPGWLGCRVGRCSLGVPEAGWFAFRSLSLSKGGCLLVGPSTGSGTGVAGLSSGGVARWACLWQAVPVRSLSLSKGGAVSLVGPSTGSGTGVAGLSSGRSLSLSRQVVPVSVPELVEGQAGCSCALRQAQGPGWLGCRIQRRSLSVSGCAGSRFRSLSLSKGRWGGSSWPFDRLRERGGWGIECSARQRGWLGAVVPVSVPELVEGRRVGRGVPCVRRRGGCVRLGWGFGGGRCGWVG